MTQASRGRLAHIGAALLLLLLRANDVHGHGRLMDPPSRNAMWRFGFSNPINYNDNEVFCGGFGIQYNKNKGKCGVCGDPWDEKTPREHEAGGRYGNGVIGKQYVEGQKIDVEVDLTTNHWGHFELKICPVNNRNRIVTQECFDKNPLFLAEDPTEFRYRIPLDSPKSIIFNYQVTLPRGLTCKQCVIQWTYRTGNTWGECETEDGTGGKIGCGDQEMFRNCADVQILSNTAGRPPIAADIYPQTYFQAIYVRDKTIPEGRRPLVVRSQVCVAATDRLSATPGMDQWCQEHCLSYPPSPDCTPKKCTCLDGCEGIGRLNGIEGTDVWCQRKCLRYPNKSTCPKEDCRCYNREEEKRRKEGAPGNGVESSGRH